MKILYISMGERYILKELIKNKFNIIGVIQPLKNYETKKLKLKKILKKILKTDLKTIAKENGIDFIAFTKDDYDKFEEFLKMKKPDIVIVFSMPFLIKKETLNLAKYGFINIHPAYLPNYRGPNPWVPQFMNLENKIGYTIHLIDEGEDTGDILFQEYMYIKDEYFNTIYKRFLAKSTKNLIYILKCIETDGFNSLILKKQPLERATPRAKRIKDAWKYIDFEEWSSKKIIQFIKNSYPWINELQGYKVRKFIKISHDKKEGSLIIKKKKILIFTKDGIIFLKRNMLESIKQILKQL